MPSAIRYLPVPTYPYYMKTGLAHSFRIHGFCPEPFTPAYLTLIPTSSSVCSNVWSRDSFFLLPPYLTLGPGTWCTSPTWTFLQSSLASNQIPHLTRLLLASMYECRMGTNPFPGTFIQVPMKGNPAPYTTSWEQNSDLRDLWLLDTALRRNRKQMERIWLPNH